ncbi:NAD(P)/FAD-dependent oxidoreductase [Agreia sp. VKM Ac-1783]|uniref:NAD(P)/FAD-dependent oxidoreductase n=1 Tax=Agreia sp. VKM Ac-1783 TaxID=1938889 RepID=UPI000A2AB3F7|nr:NAD(P)/FAD-dependent oxidoreductase [Agreia sp. VKM Ac-1783]SMQ62788.1 Dehydrogenase (flavoprotein) [Agreia sp. VKM Ac-1783]
MTPIEVDVAIVGAGPVGLAAAIEARLAGLSVGVIEPRSFPIDKACGEGLMPGAVDALARLGIHPPGIPIAGFRYTDAIRSAEHRFAGGSGLGVRRTALHDALAARADELGVTRVDTRVSDVVQNAGGVTVGDVRASWLFACDGLHSTVRRLSGLERPPRARVDRRRFGLRKHYTIEPWTDLVEVHWVADAEAYVTPLAGGLVGVAVLGPPRTDFDEVLGRIPELNARLRDAGAEEGLRGAGPLRQRSSARSVGRVLLLGDASGYVDALTGEGIRVGLAHARAAVESIVGQPARQAKAYDREWSRVSRDFRVITSGLLAAAQSPLRPLIVPAARAMPALFGAAVERLAR